MSDPNQSTIRGQRAPSKPGGGKRKNRDSRKAARREAAEARQAMRDRRSAAEQIATIVERGATVDYREARRLLSAS